MKDRALCWIAEKIAEQRLLWRLRNEAEALPSHPDDLTTEDAIRPRARRASARSRSSYEVGDHRRRAVRGVGPRSCWCRVRTWSPTISGSGWWATICRAAAPDTRSTEVSGHACASPQLSRLRRRRSCLGRRRARSRGARSRVGPASARICRSSSSGSRSTKPRDTSSCSQPDAAAEALHETQGACRATGVPPRRRRRASRSSASPASSRQAKATSHSSPTRNTRRRCAAPARAPSSLATTRRPLRARCCAPNSPISRSPTRSRCFVASRARRLAVDALSAVAPGCGARPRRVDRPVLVGWPRRAHRRSHGDSPERLHRRRRRHRRRLRHSFARCRSASGSSSAIASSFRTAR